MSNRKRYDFLSPLTEGTAFFKGLLLLLFLMQGYSAHAQWLTTGNSGIGGSNFFGTTDNKSVRIKINNTPYILLDSTYKLNITGAFTTAADSDVMRTYTTDAGMPVLRTSMRATATQTWNLSSPTTANVGQVNITTPGNKPGFVIETGTTILTNRFNLFSSPASAGEYFSLDYSSGSTALAIDSFGRIGINTTAPNNLLTIITTSAAGITLQGVNPAVTIDSGSSPVGLMGIATIAGSFSSNAKAGDLIIRTGSANNAVRNSIITNTAGGNIIFSSRNTVSSNNGGDSVRFNITKFGTVGMGKLADTAYHQDAVFVANGTTQGILIPRLTTTQVNAIANPEEGLFVYDSTLKLLRYYEAGIWNSLSGTINGWTIGGNTGVSGSSVLGTTTNANFAIATNGTNRMIADTVGNIEVKNKLFIGTVDPSITTGYLLAVNGTAIFAKLKVALYTQWPDYVFNDNYKLPSLDSVEAYIKQNKHLPGMPSADEMQKQGIDLGDNQTLLVKKMEELTLYVIQQNKNSDERDKKTGALDTEIKKLQDRDQQLLEMQKQIDDLKKLIQKNS